MVCVIIHARWLTRVIGGKAAPRSWDARVTARWARQARDAANDMTRYERISLREQVRSRRFWAALATRRWSGRRCLVGRHGAAASSWTRPRTRRGGDPPAVRTPGKGATSSMTTRAAVCRAPGLPWEITDLELDEPKANEVRIKFYAAGLCHSDDHIQKGDAPMRMPVRRGSRGRPESSTRPAGRDQGRGGDHLVCSFIPACGSCRYCSRAAEPV